MDVYLHALELRLDLDLGGIEELRIHRVVEKDHHRVSRRAGFLLVFVPEALVFLDPERCVGGEREVLFLCRFQGSFQGWEAFPCQDGHLARCGKPVGRTEGDSSVRRGGVEDLPGPRVSSQLGFAGHSQAVLFAAGPHRDVFKDGFGIDSLVEDQDHDGVQPPWATLRPGVHDGGCRGGEGPGDLFFELDSTRTLCAPGDLDLVDRGHGEAGFTLFALCLEEESFRPDPSPAPLHLGGELDGHLAGSERIEGVEGHHGL